MNNEYNFINENSYSIEIKKSKFISRSFIVSDENECKYIIEKIKKKFHDARHNVYAFSLLNGISRSSDDGEPSGTAGVQVLKVLNNFNLKNNLIIVTRYFGGILLGTGGLSRAYFSCSKGLVENSKILTNYVMKKFKAMVDYKEYNKILNSNEFIIDNVSFNEKVSIIFSVKKNESDCFKDKLENFLSRNVDLQTYKF